MRTSRAIILPVLVAWCSPTTATAAQWQLAGTTYNSVAFVDVASVMTLGAKKHFTAMRISGQPEKDGWVSVVEELEANCDTRIFFDRGSVIRQADGTLKKYDGFGATQKAVSRGIFYDMF